MTRQIDLSKADILETGRLKKSGGAYQLVALTKDHIDQILALEDIAFKDLGPEQQHYLFKKERPFFERHFTLGGTVMGVVHNGNLVAQSIVINPTPANADMRMTDVKLTKPLDKVTVLGGIIVDPAYRGNKLMDVMVVRWLAVADKNGRTEALAEVATDNSYSWAVFLKKGLHIERMGIDPTDKTDYYHVHGHVPSIAAAFNAAARKKTKTCALTDTARQKKLFKKGMKGVAFDHKTGLLTFQGVKKKNCRL